MGKGTGFLEIMGRMRRIKEEKQGEMMGKENQQNQEQGKKERFIEQPLKGEQRRDKERILALVREYHDKYHVRKKEYQKGERVPYASRVYDSQEMTNLVDSALEFWLTSGRYTEQFEQELAEYIGVKYCSLVNSGSSANLNAFMALTSPLLGERRINRGDEVITVAAGFPTTVTPMIQYGAVPVFVDVTIPQYNIDVSLLEEAYNEKTKAVMIAHTLGNPFDLKTVKAFCDEHHLWLVEDNCDALGSKYRIDGEEKFTGTIIAIVHRNDDVEEKWVVAPAGMAFTKEEIREQIHFQEQYFDSEIMM